MENQAINSLKEAKAKVEHILQFTDELRRTVSNNHVNSIRKALVFMTQQLEGVMTGATDVKPSNEEISVAVDLSRAFADITMEKPVVPIFRDLAESFLSIVHNWNAATIKNPDIATKIKLTNGIIKGQLTMLETIDVLHKTLERVKKSHQYEPPAFNLSRSYLENLKKAVEESGSDALVERK
jgi:hypothetical protein